MRRRSAITVTTLVASILLGGCTLRDRNVIALTLCERTQGCSTSSDRPVDGPPQVRALENRKMPSAAARKK